MKKKFYAVRKDIITGIYQSIEDLLNWNKLSYILKQVQI